MSDPHTNTEPEGNKQDQSRVINLPSNLPAATGSLAYDSAQSALHVTAIPCARESLLAGIAAGAGIGFIRGFSLPPLKAGNWAVATFTITSIVSWQICQNRIEREREQVAAVLEQGPRRRAVMKENADQSSTTATTSQ